ncbi:UDP-N-acetylglucosamine 1-carboxyvinyltransferase [Flavobacteriales bacterium ALC-1]|nr:UDP-N-acetylglucosamine 1-carboxyvinyltransferase [Flavobacteriales bacterium ALC-1]
MSDFVTTYRTEIINTIIVFGVLFLIQFIIRFINRRVASSKGKNLGRIRLIGRYVTFTFLLIALLIEAFVLGVKIDDLVVVFSSVFAVIGITLFASWSILSNVTSGIVMFFSFPYKIGDRIHIHDKDYEIIGVIEDIRSFQLHIRKDNSELITYPNNLILQKAVTLMEKDALNSK